MTAPETAGTGLRTAHLASRPGARPTVGEIISVLILLLIVLAAVAPRLLAPGDPLGISPADAFQAPSWQHPFGTDESGRDVYTRVVHGAGESLLIGLAATAIGLGLALVIGILGAVAGRAVDFATTRINEVLFALPGLLLALVFIAIVGPGVATTTVAVGLSTAPGYARIIRTQIRAVRGSAYIEAAVVLGHSSPRILGRHILPNALAPVFVLATLGVGQAIVWASSLSFLGLGAVPPAPEWGAMLAAGRPYIELAWWMTVCPGLAIVATAAASTALGRSIQARTRQGDG
ncbi:ABC transporter permease [Salinibacterium sp. SYSU T00001]|uniref:ABC transporter permease n=1 Tax=Homoserinimonas sedimenticola TaxID=2986805 RepID=UPI0022356C9A|nr:ABC transporter permease [Salinibacterium sedimenticola]MCW4384669.1 ABC transporter permease [Salinibacterium sedimenticola]